MKTVSPHLVRPSPSAGDASSRVEELRTQIYRDMPAWKKAHLVEDANHTARQLGLAGIRARHGDEPLHVTRRRLLGLILGEATATTIYGPIDGNPP